MLAVFKHVSYEGPGLIEEMLEGRGLPYRVLDVFKDGVPLSAAGLNGIVSMGGPMSANDGLEEIEREKQLLLEAMDRETPVLGICLGAQIIASALGASVYPGRKPEVGWGEVLLTPEGQSDPLMAGVDDVLPVLHWHGETFDLPEGAVRLASSEVCENQAFRVRDRAYGFQFHLEVDPEMVLEWVEMDAEGGGGLVSDRNAVVEGIRPCLGRVRLSGALIFGRFLDLVAGRTNG